MQNKLHLSKIIDLKNHWNKKRIAGFIIFFYLIFFICNNLNAQQVDSASSTNRFNIKINPLQLPTGEIRFLLEKSISTKSSMELTIGYIFNCGMQQNVSLIDDIGNSTNIQGCKAGIGYRYYLKKSHKGRSAYLNPLFFYKYLHYANISKSSRTYSPLDIEVKDVTYNIVSFQFQYGFIRSWKRLLFDYYVGAGLRYKYAIATEVSSRPEVIIPSQRLLESGFYPCINLGLNIGYNFL